MASTINATPTSSGLIQTADNSGVLALQTGGTTAVTVDGSQNVGIGESTPAGSTGYTQLVVRGSSGAELSLKGGTTQYGYVYVDSGGFRIINPQSGASSGTLQFSTSNTERMRIDSSGNVLVGNSAQISSEKVLSYQTANGKGIMSKVTNASFTQQCIQAEVDRNTTNGSFAAFAYYNSGAGATRFQVLDSGNVQNTNNSYGAISDVKLKENIVDTSPKLEDLCKVKIRNYNLKSDQTQKQIGVIAQELEKVFPSLVEEFADKDDEGNDLNTTTKAVKYSVFVPMLIKAIQELNAKVVELEAKLNAK